MKDYCSNHLIKYEDPEDYGTTSIRILNMLIGKKWDEAALNYVHSVRPSSIRVTNGCTTMDSVPWRATVEVDCNNIIVEVSQEVVVGLDGGFTCGEHLEMALKYGSDSPQSNWYRDDSITLFKHDGENYSKICKDGEVPFPETEMKTDEEILKEHDWEMECESPLEIRHKDGSFASGSAAILVIADIRYGDD